MARVKRSVNAKKKRRAILKSAKGYRGQRSRLYRKAKEQWLHSMTYAYRDRRARKSEFRKLWIQRINAAARMNDITYNRLIHGLKLAEVEVDRKILADLAVNDIAAFNALVEIAKKNFFHVPMIRRSIPHLVQGEDSAGGQDSDTDPQVVRHGRRPRRREARVHAS